ncbi:MAG: histidine ammonia-lyase [Bradymonadaceae bacterium]|nr:histidine ammonia-lyase [Lujinxingiaceae bacterium]
MNIGEYALSLEEIEYVVVDRVAVSLGAVAVEKIEAAARYVREMAMSGQAVYGVTTGFGANRDKVIRPEDTEILQERLLMSHACGMGPALPVEVVRAMMLLRITALAHGNSGVRASTLQVLVDMLNAGVHPVVPELGSVGASGDLCPLAHMCLPIIGLGEVNFDGERMSGAQGFARAGLSPVRLTYKEGLALLNGTQAMTALGVVTALAFRRLLDCADVIGAMSLEAVAGRLEALDPRIHAVRRRPGQIACASNIRAMLTDSELAGAMPGTVHGKVEYVQDSYCLRCMPQVHGASRDVLEHVIDVLMTEVNAVTDNPLVFVPDGFHDGAILSGGNFHGQPVAMALDYLKIAIAEIGSISERRSAKLTDKYFSEGLPAFLISEPGLNSGMMIPQYAAAALVSENKSQSFPASVDSIPTSANMEDHVSMGMHAGLHGHRILINVERVLGIEYLIAAQALDLRVGFRLGQGTGQARDAMRERVPFMEQDRVLYPDIEAATALVREGVPGCFLHTDEDSSEHEFA